MSKILFWFIVPLTLWSVELKLHKDVKAKFSVKYPADWKPATDSPDAAFMVSSADATANVQIKTATLKGKATACEYLAESAAADGRENLIPENKRVPEEAQIQALGVKTACIGAYRIMQGQNEIMQGVGVYVSGKNVWLLIQTVQAASRDLHLQAVGEIAKSFTTR